MSSDSSGSKDGLGRSENQEGNQAGANMNENEESAGDGEYQSEPDERWAQPEQPPEPEEFDLKARLLALKADCASLVEANKRAYRDANIKPLPVILKKGIPSGKAGAWGDSELHHLRLCWYGCFAQLLERRGAKDGEVFQRYTDFHNKCTWDSSRPTTDSNKDANRVAPFARLSKQVRHQITKTLTGGYKARRKMLIDDPRCAC
jgi:hypothetical protein